MGSWHLPMPIGSPRHPSAARPARSSEVDLVGPTPCLFPPNPSARTWASPPSTVSLAARDSILVIIDAQNEYASGLLAVSQPNIAYSRPNILTLLQLRTSSTSRPPAHPFSHLTPPLAEEFSELAPLERASPQSSGDFEAVVQKRFPGSFAETDLQDVIARAGPEVRKVVLVGYMAHVCVSTTAREAHQRGYDVIVVSDAIGDRDIPEVPGRSGTPGLGATGEEVTKMVILELADIFATVLKTEDVQ
ncbi:isochorismatase family hydrolase [Mycena olivaceomarginata]|nr:isochorismatase family hydrolase [Mycena olivaceomarginata]